MKHCVIKKLCDKNFKLTPNKGYVLKDLMTDKLFNEVIVINPNYFIAIPIGKQVN